MTTHELIGISFLQGLVGIAIFVVCFLMVVVILLQKGRGGGLSSAFGGGSSTSPFGSKTGDVFTWITVGFAAAFLLLTIVGNFVFRPPTVAQPSQATSIEVTPEASEDADGVPLETTDTPALDDSGATEQSEDFDS